MSVATSAGEFTLDVYKEILKTSENKNVFMSPTSILVVMAMVQAGTKNETRKQLLRGLKIKHEDQNKILQEFEGFVKVLKQGSQSVTLETANRLYPDEGKDILAEYLDAVSKHFASEVIPLDFKSNPEGSRVEINKWVEEVTRNKIKNILKEGSINQLTRLVLVNAIYFKGNWETQFKPESTKKDTFNLFGGGSIQVDMMKGEMKKVRYGVNRKLGCKVLHLPYVGTEMVMVVILPDDVNGLPTLEKSLDASSLTDLIEDVHSPTVNVSLPKFKLESSFELKETLSALGMADVFDEVKADLSGMGSDLYLSQVFHKAFVDVNEEGTEAAAATAAVNMYCSMPAPPQIFKADHPFMFMIWHYKLGVPLFIGRYVHPQSGCGEA